MAVIAALLVGACGTAATPASTSSQAAGATTGTTGAPLTGDIRLDGSSTVYPIAEAIAEEFQARNRRPIDRAFVHSIFNRDHPGTADQATIDAFATEILKLDDSVPTGTYVDMCSRLPLVDPEKIAVPTLVLRGQWDGIASMEDLIAFFQRLPNPDKHLAVMPGISHASFQQKNYLLVYHILWSFFAQPDPVYRG